METRKHNAKADIVLTVLWDESNRISPITPTSRSKIMASQDPLRGYLCAVCPVLQWGKGEVKDPVKPIKLNSPLLNLGGFIRTQ